MTIEISSDDPATIEKLKELAATDTRNITALPITPMDGNDVLTLLIQNFESVSAGAVAIIAALRASTPYIRISKNGIQIGEAEKKKLLDGD